MLNEGQILYFHLSNDVENDVQLGTRHERAPLALFPKSSPLHRALFPSPLALSPTPRSQFGSLRPTENGSLSDRLYRLLSGKRILVEKGKGCYLYRIVTWFFCSTSQFSRFLRISTSIHTFPIRLSSHEEMYCILFERVNCEVSSHLTISKLHIKCYKSQQVVGIFPTCQHVWLF